jgi:hypothetical protein
MYLVRPISVAAVGQRRHLEVSSESQERKREEVGRE